MLVSGDHSTDITASVDGKRLVLAFKGKDTLISSAPNRGPTLLSATLFTLLSGSVWPALGLLVVGGAQVTLVSPSFLTLL